MHSGDILSDDECNDLEKSDFDRPSTPSAGPDGLRTCPFEGCLKRFKKVSHMDRHMRQHTGEVCKTSFVFFKNHRVLQRPFSCHLCDRSFGRSEHLRRHILAHGTASSRLVCAACDLTFLNEKELKGHQKIHDVEVFFTSFAVKLTFTQCMDSAEACQVHVFRLWQSLSFRVGAKVSRESPYCKSRKYETPKSPIKEISGRKIELSRLCGDIPISVSTETTLR